MTPEKSPIAVSKPKLTKEEKQKKKEKKDESRR